MTAGQGHKILRFLSRPGGFARLRDYIFRVCVCVCVCVMSGKNVKVFELTIFLSSTMNMVTQIIYLGRMEVGDWYYAVCFKKKKILNRVYGSLNLDNLT